MRRYPWGRAPERPTAFRSVEPIAKVEIAHEAWELALRRRQAVDLEARAWAEAERQVQETAEGRRVRFFRWYDGARDTFVLGALVLDGAP